MSPELGKQSGIPAENPQTSEYFSDITGILDKFNTLMERLPTFHRPTHQTTSFSFFTRSPEELSYPDAVLDYMMTNELVEIGVDITQDENNAPSTSFEFVFDSNGQKVSIYASRVTPEEEESTSKFEEPHAPSYEPITGDSNHDALLYKQAANLDKEIPKIPNHQLNSFLFSLAGNTIDAMLARDDPYGHNIVDASTMTTSLANSAISQESDYSFELDPAGTRTISYHIIENGYRDMLSDLVFQYETGSSRSISVTIDQEKGFSLSYQTTDQGENGGLHPLYPDDGDYIRLNEILDEELAKLG
ncbi:hypothetical protein I8H83_02080 [Candidatus Saccharibacteria bacterium]|nr:hypothetical protein [Candidatus Saccharibacteria bacterium]